MLEVIEGDTITHCMNAFRENRYQMLSKAVTWYYGSILMMTSSPGSLLLKLGSRFEKRRLRYLGVALSGSLKEYRGTHLLSGWRSEIDYLQVIE